MTAILIFVGNRPCRTQLLAAAARRIFEALPLEGGAHVWGEEIYFDVTPEMELEPDARADACQHRQTAPRLQPRQCLRPAHR